METALEDGTPLALVRPPRPVGAARLKQSIAPLMLMALGAAAVFGSLDLGLGTLHTPKPGLWPLATSLLVVVCALYLLIRPEAVAEERFSRKSLSVAAGIGILAVFIVLFEAIGFLLPAVGLLVLWLRVFGERSWRSTIILSVAGPAAFFVIFESLLGVPLPDDLLLRVFS